MAEGDVVVLFASMEGSMILRRMTFWIRSYIHEIMDGEAWPDYLGESDHSCLCS
jgi:hypothetical protein